MRANAKPNGFSHHSQFYVLSALGLGIALCAILAVWLRNIETREAQHLFERHARARFEAIANGVTDAVEALVSINQFFSALPDVDRAQFKDFTRPLLERHPYVQAFAFQRYVRDSERALYEKEQRKVFPGFTIREGGQGALVSAPTRQRYRVVDFVEPFKGNEAVHGFDVSSLPFQDEAIKKSIATGGPVATGLFRLVQENGGQRGFTIVMPVYRHAGTRGQPEYRRYLAGFTNATFRAGDLVEKILTRSGLLASNDVDIAVYAGTEPLAENLAWRHEGSIARGWADLPSWLQPESSELTARSRIFTVGDGNWLMVVSPVAGATVLPHAASWLVLLIGSLMTILFVAYIDSLIRRNAEYARSNEALRKSQRELRDLASHQERVKEDERKRIAREIHDDLGQNLLALRIDVTLLQARSHDAPPAVREALQSLLKQIDVTVRSVRNIINNLRPGVLDLGLRAAIEWQVRQLNERQRTVFRLSIANEEFGNSLDDDRATAIFRMVQESLTNVMRHANASQAEVMLYEHAGRLHIVISDNGVGAYPGDQRKPRSFGLVGIKERIAVLGGEFSMESVPQKGTTLRFDIDLVPVENTRQPVPADG